MLKKIDSEKIIESKIKNLKRNAEEKKTVSGNEDYRRRRYKELTMHAKMLEDGEVECMVKIYLATYYLAKIEINDRFYVNKKKEWRESFIKGERIPNNDDKNRAWNYLFSASFRSNNVSKDSVTGVDDKGIVDFKEHLNLGKGKSWLTEFNKRMKGVKVLCKDFNDVLNLYDDDVTIYYLDPPYFLTCQYNEGFTDVMHLRLLKWLRTTKCKWIFSCKDVGTNILEVINWGSRLGDKDDENKEMIYVSNLDKIIENNKRGDESDKEMPELKEYFKGFIYPMIPMEDTNNYLEKVKRKNKEKIKVYIADEQEEKKREDKLYVYKHKDEVNAEIMISNIRVSDANNKVLEDSRVLVTEFEKYFKL